MGHGGEMLCIAADFEDNMRIGGKVAPRSTGMELQWDSSRHAMD
jgi:hypothetical protein